MSTQPIASQKMVLVLGVILFALSAVLIFGF